MRVNVRVRVRVCVRVRVSLCVCAHVRMCACACACSCARAHLRCAAARRIVSTAQMRRYAQTEALVSDMLDEICGDERIWATYKTVRCGRPRERVPLSGSGPKWERT